MVKYGPRQETKDLLDQALGFVKSVDYKVSLRWLFYRMVQSHGLQKDDYGSFKQAIARARKGRHRGWHPATLSDETRSIHEFGDGHSSLSEWVWSVCNLGVKCRLDKHVGQEYHVEIWFEAQAMYEQFKKYTAPYYVDLTPFRGDASIDLKWRLSQRLREERLNGKRAVVLYFGDLDEKGMSIPKDACRDIREWAKLPENLIQAELAHYPPEFVFIRVGLQPEHVHRYNIPSNPDRPEQYQWEALEDYAAKELITEALGQYIDLEQIEQVKQREEKAENALQEYLSDWEPTFEETKA